MADYDYDSYDYQDVPAVSTADNYDAYDFGGAGQAGWQGSPEIFADVVEGLQLTGVDLDTWGGGTSTTTEKTTGDFARMDRAPASIAQAAEPSSTADKFAKFLSGAGDFVNKYKTPLEMVGRGLQAAAKSKSDQKAAQTLSDSRIRELQEADRLKQSAAGRYSESVKGLRTGGLVNQGKLTRVGGAQVYGPTGLINRS